MRASTLTSLKLVDSRVLRIGIDGPVTSAPLLTLLRLLQTDAPSLRWRLHDTGPAQQYKALCRGELDIAFWRGQPVAEEQLARDSLCQQLYCREETAIALPKEHRLARKNSIALSDLGDEALLAWPTSVVGLPAVMAMVGSGLGGALVPGSAGNIVFPNVTVRRFRGAPSTHLYLAHGIDTGSGAMQPFLEILNKERGIRPFCVSSPPPSQES